MIDLPAVVAYITAVLVVGAVVDLIMLERRYHAVIAGCGKVGQA